MSNEKAQRHRQDHDDLKDPELGETDLEERELEELELDEPLRADSEQDKKASDRKDEKKKKKGEAGDKDIRGYIVGADPEGKKTRITIANMTGAFGSDGVIKRGMTGYVVVGRGMSATFTIDKIAGTGAQAVVDLPKDGLPGHEVVLNPTSVPAKVPPTRDDVHANIVDKKPAAGSWKIYMDAGVEEGVRVQMRGHLLINGKAHGQFTVQAVSDHSCWGYVTVPADQLNQSTEVLINPSKP